MPSASPLVTARPAATASAASSVALRAATELAADAVAAGLAAAHHRELRHRERLELPSGVQKWGRVADRCQQRWITRLPQHQNPRAKRPQPVVLLIHIHQRLRVPAPTACQRKVLHRRRGRTRGDQFRRAGLQKRFRGAEVQQQAPELTARNMREAVQQKALTGVIGIHTSSLT